MALLSAAKSERARRFAQVEMVFRLPHTYQQWCGEVYQRNHFYNSMLAQVCLCLSPNSPAACVADDGACCCNLAPSGALTEDAE